MNIVLYTNILSPYRKHFYDAFYEECKKRGHTFRVLIMAATEPNRTWKYEEYQTEYTILLKDITLDGNGACIHINFGLTKMLKTLKPDVLICSGNYLCPGVWQGAWLKKRLGYHCLYWSESHLNEVRNYQNAKLKIREMIRSRVYRMFEGFWYAGAKSAEFIRTYAVQNAEYHFVPNLVEDEKYSLNVSAQQKRKLREKFGVADSQRVFFCPARLHPAKGICEFLELLNKSEHKCRATILVAGSGELEKDIRDLGQKYSIDIRLLGQKTQEETLELYSAADVFLLPSKSDPNPLSCIEASWAQLPLLISEHCGNYPEIIRQGENGYVFRYSEPEQAVTYINHLLTADEAWLKQAGEIARGVAEKTYATKATVERIVTEMEQIAAKK